MQHDDNSPSRSPQHIKPIGFDQPGGGKKAKPVPAAASQTADGTAETARAAEKGAESEDEHGPGDKPERSYMPVGF